MRARRIIEKIGQRLLTFTGTYEIDLPNGGKKTRNEWQDHGVFLSRSLAQDYAKAKYAGRRYHIEGVRMDVTPIESGKREDRS